MLHLGMLPLHLAVANGASEAVVAALLRAYPEAAKEKDNRGRLPLHSAVEHGASEAVVLALLRACPEAAKEKDEDKKLPLHWALYTEYNGWIKATEVEGESKAVGAKVIYQGREMVVSRGVDSDGKLMLKPPAVNDEVILALLQAYPEAAKESTPFM